MDEDIKIGCFIMVVVLGIFFGFIALTAGGIAPNYSDGTRTGDIYKFSKKGIFWKSWEGEMYLGGYHSTGGKSPTIETDKFYFSIPESDEASKKDVIDSIQKCTETRKKCSIIYKEWFIGPIKVEDSHIAVGVKMEE